MNNQRVFQYLWAYDPQSNRVHFSPDEADHPADYPHHQDADINHPDAVYGYALPIEDGWRIFTDDLKEPDTYITNKVQKALQGVQEPELPSIRYHGDPGESFYSALTAGS